MSHTELENYVAATRELIHILSLASKIKITISSPSKRSSTPSVYIKRSGRHSPMMITVVADRSTPLDLVARKIIAELLRLTLFHAIKVFRSMMYVALALASFVLAFVINVFSPNLAPFSILAAAMGVSSLIELVLPYIARRKWPDSRIWELHRRAYAVDGKYRALYDSLYRVIYTVLQACLADGGNGIIETRVLPPFRYSVETAHGKHRWCVAYLEPILLGIASRGSQR